MKTKNPKGKQTAQSNGSLKPVGSASAKQEPMTECDNCGNALGVTDSHSCEKCGATLCNQCICQKCD